MPLGRRLSVMEKVLIIRAIEQGYTKADVGRCYGVARNTLFKLWKNREAILKAEPQDKSEKKNIMLELKHTMEHDNKWHKLTSSRSESDNTNRKISGYNKLCVIRALERGDKKRDVAKRFGLKLETVVYIWKKKNTILQAKQQDTSSKAVKKPKFEDLEEVLLSWFNEQRQNNEPISGTMIKAQAAVFAKQLGITEFKVSETWFANFKLRHNLIYRQMNDEEMQSLADLRRRKENLKRLRNKPNKNKEKLKAAGEKNLDEAKQDQNKDEIRTENYQNVMKKENKTIKCNTEKNNQVDIKTEIEGNEDYQSQNKEETHQVIKNYQIDAKEEPNTNIKDEEELQEENENFQGEIKMEIYVENEMII